jgi:hypothetical protein
MSLADSLRAKLAQSFFEKFMIAEDKDRELDPTDACIPLPTVVIDNLPLLLLPL